MSINIIRQNVLQMRKLNLNKFSTICFFIWPVLIESRSLLNTIKNLSKRDCKCIVNRFASMKKKNVFRTNNLGVLHEKICEISAFNDTAERANVESFQNIYFFIIKKNANTMIFSVKRNHSLI